MPMAIKQESEIHAVELDIITSNILSQLHPYAKVYNQGYEKYHDYGYDLIIGNPPYGDMKLIDDKHSDLSNKGTTQNSFTLEIITLIKIL